MSRLTKRGELYSKGVDISWQKWRPCDLCGQLVCYNNFPDHLGRQKRYIFRGLFMCSACDPRGFAPGGKRRDDVIFNRRRYKTVLAHQLMRKLATYTCYIQELQAAGEEAIDSEPCGKCPPCLARKIEAIKV